MTASMRAAMRVSVYSHSRICTILTEPPHYYRNPPLPRHINRLHQSSYIFQLSFAAQAAEMAHDSTSHHPAQTLEVRSSQKPVSLEVVAQPPANLFIGQAFEFQASFQAFHLESAEFILQRLVCTEFDGFRVLNKCTVSVRCRCRRCRRLAFLGVAPHVSSVLPLCLFCPARLFIKSPL